MLYRQLRIELSKRQLLDIYGTPVIYTGTNPQSIVATPGTEDTTWYDFTHSIDGLQDLDIDFSVDYTPNLERQEGQFTVQKSTSGTLTLERDAYDFVKSHLVDSVAAAVNEIEVRITDVSCGRYLGYTIRARQLEWCEVNALCTYEVNLNQLDPYINCIERTAISDNWQGWFQDVPADGKKHPRFSYCVEIRPNWTLVAIWVLTSILALVYGVIYTILYPALLLIYAIIVVINTIIDVINTIIDFVNTLGAGIPNIPNIPAVPPATPGDVFDAWATLMIESGGCGREHPAPLIRDYISNVCSKCGVSVSAETADIFFAPYLTLTHSDGIQRTEPNPHYNACYFDPTVVRGIRRFRSINLVTGNIFPDTTTFYQRSNAPIMNLPEFLDQLKMVYNAQWRLIDEDVAGVSTPTLYFKRKDWFINQVPLFDFSVSGADRKQILQGLCYRPRDVKYPASCSWLYQRDFSDKCGDEAKYFYNGDRINFGFTVVNPMFKGVLEKETQIACARFNCDGASTNYLYDALQACFHPVSFLTPVILGQLATAIERYANYAILMQTEQVSIPKIVIWDGDTDNPGDPTYINARAVRDKINIAGTVFTVGHTGWPGTVAGITTPDINTLYPSETASAPGSTFLPSTTPAPLPWETVHAPKTNVLNRIFPASPPDGVYAVINNFGSTLIPAPAILVNYPMYFEPHFKGTLWDWFHWIDDPTRARLLNKEWSVKVPLCCDNVRRLNLTDTTNGMALLQPVLLDTPYFPNGLITSIKVAYSVSDDDDQSDSVGQYIEIKGLV